MNNFLPLMDSSCRYHGATDENKKCVCYGAWEGDTCQKCKCAGNLCSSVGYCCNPQNSELPAKYAKAFPNCRCREGYGSPTCNKKEIFVTNEEFLKIMKIVKPTYKMFTIDYKPTNLKVDCMDLGKPDDAINPFDRPIIHIYIDSKTSSTPNPLVPTQSIFFIHGKQLYHAFVVNPRYFDLHNQSVGIVCWPTEVYTLPLNAPNDSCFVSNIWMGGKAR